MIILVDAMGGDNAPDAVIKGAELTSNSNRTATSLLYTQNAHAFSLFNKNLTFFVLLKKLFYLSNRVYNIK